MSTPPNWFCYSLFVTPNNPKVRIHGTKLMKGFQLCGSIEFTEREETDLWTEFRWANLTQEIMITIKYNYIVPEQLFYDLEKDRIMVRFSCPVNIDSIHSKIEIISVFPTIKLNIVDDYLVASLHTKGYIKQFSWTCYDLINLNDTNAVKIWLYGFPDKQAFSIIKSNDKYIIFSNTKRIAVVSTTNKQRVNGKRFLHDGNITSLSIITGELDFVITCGKRDDKYDVGDITNNIIPQPHNFHQQQWSSKKNAGRMSGNGETTIPSPY